MASSTSTNGPSSAPGSSQGSHTYTPLPPSIYAPLERYRDQFGTHGFIISGNAFDSAQLTQGWDALVDIWPVLAAKLVRGDQLPSSAASFTSSTGASNALFLQIPDASALRAERTARRSKNEAAAAPTAVASPTPPAATGDKPRSAPGPAPSIVRKLLSCLNTSSTIQDDTPMEQAPSGPSHPHASPLPGSRPPSSGGSDSFCVVSARKGLSIREALSFRRPEELPTQSISTMPSIDDKTIFDGEYAQNASRSIDELLKESSASKMKVVSVQVTLFEDGMLFVLSAPVAFLDARGALEVVSAWTGVMSTPQLLPSPLPNFSSTVAAAKTSIEAATSSALEMSATDRALLPTPYGWFKYTRWESILFRLRSMLGSCKAAFQSGLETRELWIPQEVVDALMSQARMDLQREGHEVDGDEGRVAVEHVLLAWLVQSMGKGRGRSSTPLSILVPKDLRLVTAKDGKSFAPTPFIGGNASLPTVPLSEIPHSTVQASRLGVLALRIRYAQESQTAPDAATGIIQWQVANQGATALEDGSTHGFHFHSPSGDPMIFDDLHASAAACAPLPKGATAAATPATSSTTSLTAQLLPVDFTLCLLNANETAGKPTVTKFELPVVSAASPPAPLNGELLHTFSFIGRPSLRKREPAFSLPTPVSRLQKSHGADGSATGSTIVVKGYVCGGQLEKRAWAQKSGLGAGEAVRL